MYKKFIFILAVSLLATPVLAADMPLTQLAPLNLRAVYHFGYGSIIFGKVGVEIAQPASGYSITCDVVSTGIVKVFVQHSSHTSVKGEGHGLPAAKAAYVTDYQTKKKKKHVDMVYEQGKVTKENAMPPDNRATRPAVSTELKDKSYDPLTFTLAMRQKLFEALKKHEDSYMLYVYDGRRLTQVDFKVIGPKVIALDKVQTAVVQVDVSRILLEGFTASELASGKAKEPPLHVYFTQDERLIPVLFEVPMWLGTIRASLARECADGESCLFGIKE